MTTPKKTKARATVEVRSKSPDPYRMNLRFPLSRTAQEIRDAAAAHNQRPAQFVEKLFHMYSENGMKLAFREELSKGEIEDYLMSAAVAPPDPVALAELRLSQLLAKALGTKHPAIDDLALLMLRSKELEKIERTQRLKHIDTVRVAEGVDATKIADLLANANFSKGGIIVGTKLDAVAPAPGSAMGKASTEVITGMDVPQNRARMATAEEADAFHEKMQELQSTAKAEQEPKSNDTMLWRAMKALAHTVQELGNFPDAGNYGDAVAVLAELEAHHGMGTAEPALSVSSLWAYGYLTTKEEDAQPIAEEDLPESPMTLLREVSDNFTSNDDLPNGLLQRIDKALARNTACIDGDKLDTLEGKAIVRDEMWAIVKSERPDLAGGTATLSTILTAALRGTLASPRGGRTAPDESLEAQVHQAIVRTARFNKKEQGYIMGAYRNAVIAYVQNNRESLMPPHGQEFVHKVTGGRYRVIGQGLIQSNVPLDDMERVMIYQGRDGKLWARPMKEWSMKFVRADAVTPATINPGARLEIVEPDRPETIGEAHAMGIETAYTEQTSREAFEPKTKDVAKQERSARTFEKDAEKGADGFDSILLNKRLCVTLPDSLRAQEGDSIIFREVGLDGYTGRNIQRFITHATGLRLGGTLVSFIDLKEKRDRGAPDTDRLLRELLAIMHRDGGHYAAKHGLYKATADAISRLTADRVILEGKRLRPFDEMWAAFSKKRGMLYGRDAVEQVRVGYNMVEEAIQEAYWTLPVHQPNIRERTIFKHLGFILATSDETEFMGWGDSGPEWSTDRSKALRFARREDAELVANDSEKAWKIKPFEDIEEFRQQLGEKLSEILDTMDENHVMDWPNSDNVDIVLDFIMPTITGDITP